MVKSAQNKRGMSLMSALLLITIVMTVAAAMAGVFTLNMNITNRVSNSDVALSEAEAGIAEVLYQITREENIDGTNADSNPRINWGLNGETIRATITPGLGTDEAYHLVTFDPASSFPYSTNNTNLDRDTGYNGRVVPDGMIHIVSTGYCKGQFRTVECVVEKPPFPFGLATSGPIRSADPIVVRGTSSQANYANDEEDRPGHLLCNSSEGVVIGSQDGKSTEISGFVKSVGSVTIEQPAIVRGGIRSFADVSSIADIDIQDFNLASTQDEGVISILDDRFDEEQNLDVMYKYSGSHLQYMSSVNLQQAMIWVDGDLTIHGPLTGEGLIVVNGDATFNSGSNLSGSDKLAVLAAGDITIDGRYNHFSGLVYSEGNLSAKNVTIVGNVVVNSQNSDKGQANLENVTVVSNEETADMTITVRSQSDAEVATNVGHRGAPALFGPNGTPNGNNDGWIGGHESDDHMYFIAANQLKSAVFDNIYNPDVEIVPISPTGDVGNAGHLWAGLASLAQIGIDAEGDVDELETQIQGWEDEMDGLDPDDDDDASRISDLNDLISNARDQQETLKEEAEVAYLAQARTFVIEVRDWTRRNANSGGSLDVTNSEDTAVEVDHHFNLNEYLPQSERVKMSFWRVYPRRL